MTSGPAGPGQDPAAVLFDMDGTLLDSEKVWDVSLQMLAGHLGGRLSDAGRQAIVGTPIAVSIRLLHADLGVEADPAASADYLAEATAQLFATDLVWRPGAEQLLDAVRAAGIPTALVTSTQRRLTEIALQVIGRHRFDVTVCGDEVARTKPAPDPYRQAAAALGVEPGACVAVEDSPVGVESARAAGCAVLVTPSHVPIAPGAGLRVVDSLLGVGVPDLREVLRQAQSQSANGSGVGSTSSG